MRINDVDDWVQSVSQTVDRFYPTAPAKATGLPLEAVFRQLIGLAHIGWLEVVYEVRCIECNLTIAIESVSDPTLLYEQEYSCHICGDDLDVTAENVYPLFVVRDKWSSGLKKVPAANGQKAYPTGGEPTSIGKLSKDDEVRWSDVVFRKEDIEALRELAQASPEIRKAVIELDGRFPTNSTERRSKLAVLKEVGETANEWADVIKKCGIAAAPYSPAVYVFVERVLSKFGLG